MLNLYEKGIFDIKDAINRVADRLNISKHTVYLYIRQFKSGDFRDWISNAFCPHGDRPSLWHAAGEQRRQFARAVLQEGHELACVFLSRRRA